MFALSRRAISDGIIDLSQDIEKNTEGFCKQFQFYALACVETTDITNTAQLAVFVCGITAKFDHEKGCCQKKPSMALQQATTRLETCFIDGKTRADI